MNLVSWNYQRMGSPLKFNAIKDIIEMENPDILMVQETKLNEQDSGKIIQKIRNYEGSSLQESGALRGIYTLWRKGKWELVHHIK